MGVQGPEIEQEHSFSAPESVWDEGETPQPPPPARPCTPCSVIPSVIALVLFAGLLGAALVLALASGGALLPLWVALAFVPGVLLIAALYAWRRETVEWNKLLLFFFIGVLSTVLAFGLETGLEFVVGIVLDLALLIGVPTGLVIVIYLLCFAFLVAALVEETIKYSMSLLCTIRTSVFPLATPWGYMVLSLTAAAGFATAENVEYVMLTYFSPGTSVLASTRGQRYRMIYEGIMDSTEITPTPAKSMILLLVMRGLMSVPLHAYTGISYGSDGGRIFFSGPDKTTKSVLARIAHMMWLPLLVHGTFDFVLLFGSAYDIQVIVFWIALALAVLVWGLLVYKVGRMRQFERTEYQANNAVENTPGQHMENMAELGEAKGQPAPVQ